MSESISVVGRIRTKVQALASKNAAMGSEISELKSKISILENSVAEKDKSIEELNEKIKMLKMAKSLDGGSDNKEMKLKINELVREIDKCIALVNK